MEKGNAYFTVEAALVLPMVISAMLLGIFLVCYQYDRCLLEQDMGRLMIQGRAVVTENAGDTQKAVEQIRKQAAQIYRGKYAAWSFTDINIRLDQNKLSCTGVGELVFPVPEWNFWNREQRWQAEISYDSGRLSPVFYIRQYRKLHRLFEKKV